MAPHRYGNWSGGWPGAAFGEHDEGVEVVLAVFGCCGEVASDGAELAGSGRGAEAAGYFLPEFDHADVAFGSVVVRGYSPGWPVRWGRCLGTGGDRFGDQVLHGRQRVGDLVAVQNCFTVTDLGDVFGQARERSVLVRVRMIYLFGTRIFAWLALLCRSTAELVKWFVYVDRFRLVEVGVESVGEVQGEGAEGLFPAVHDGAFDESAGGVAPGGW
jgi:hypothetical protein